MAKNPFGNVRRGFGSTVNFSTTINGITYTDTDAFLAYRKGLYSKSFKIDNKKIKSEIVSIAKKFSNILDREVAKALGGRVLKERSGRGVQPDIIFDNKVSEVKGISVILDDSGTATKASKIDIAGSGRGINLTSTKRIATTRAALEDDSKSVGVDFTKGRGEAPSLIDQLVAAKDDNRKLKTILSGGGAAAKLRKNFMMKSGDIRIPVTVRGSNTPDIRAIRFPWKAIKNNDKAIIKITEADDGDVFFQIYFTERYVRDTINNANKAAAKALDTYSQELARELAITHAALSPEAIKYLEVAGIKVDFIVDKGSALIGAGRIKKTKKESKSTQQGFISGIQITALVRKRLEDTMSHFGEATPPLLKYRTGRFVDSVNVFPNYRTGLMSYTLNPLYRSLEDYGYKPDNQVMTSIRQVVQSLYSRQFQIVRAT